MSRSLFLARRETALPPASCSRALLPILLTHCASSAASPSSAHSGVRSPWLSVASRRHLHTTSSRSRPFSAQSTRNTRFHPQQRRRQAYHSESHPTPPPTSESYTPEQAAILSSALSYVPTHGFSTHALTLGARDAGYLDVSLQLFPRGGEAELVMYWLASRREELKRRVEHGEVFGAGEKQKDTDSRGDHGGQGTMSVQDKVRTLIIERLKMNEGVIGHWQDALATMSLPSNVPSSLCELHTLSSDILHLAGDNSIDASWYTKRASVATVYASAEVIMTEDSSEGFTSTVEFVDRRIQDANTVVDAVGNAKEYAGYVAGSVLAAGRSFGMKI